jgi:hypothetical protein
LSLLVWRGLVQALLLGFVGMRWIVCLSCVVAANSFAAPAARPSIAILDSFTVDGGDKSLWKPLQRLGSDDLQVYDRTSAEDAVERIGQASAILTSKVVINADVVRAHVAQSSNLVIF